MRTQHRGSRAGHHRPEVGESRVSRRRRQSTPGYGKLLPLAAFVAVGALTAWMAVGFIGSGDETNVASANPAPVSDSSKGTSTGAGTGGADGADSKTTQTKYGPLTAADRDFMDKVRQAGAWEGPTGRQAQERAGSQKVKDVGLQLVSDHAQLDAKVIAVAQQLGHTLPTGPSTQQQGWMDELSQAQGAEYDQLFADRLRAAHGKVFAVVADIRAGTKNGMIRQLAQTTNAAVLKHMTILEGTGFVNFGELPDAKPPAGPAVPPAKGGKTDGNGAQTSSGGNSGNSGSNSNGGPIGGGQPDLGNLPQNNQAGQNLQPASSRSQRDGGVDNTIIVIMLAVAGVISAITYMQLHRRRR